MKLRACHISDTHDVNQSLNMLVPNDIDIVFFTGDMTYRGADWELQKLLENFKALKQRVKYIVGTLGNHEKGAEGKEAEWKQKFLDVGVILLDHESVEIEGIKIFGSPYTPWFFDWAFSYRNPEFNLSVQDEDSRLGKHVWENIPEDTNIVLTHGPPKFIQDLCRSGHAGCHALRERIESIPSITHHMFGHIHESYGITEINKVTYINSSIMNGKYNFVNKPHLFNLEVK